MSALASVPPELVALPAFAVAAGLDLYLVLLFLGVAPHTGWWDSLPGALGDLSSGGVLAIAGSFYALELAAERWPPTALVWNAFHAIIRPLAGALLALLLLDAHPPSTRLPAALGAGLLASAAHAMATGDAVIRWLAERRVPRGWTLSLAEDAVAMGLLALALDAPTWSLAATAILVGFALRGSGSRIRAFAFTVRLAVGRAWRLVVRPKWSDPSEFPAWVRAALEGDPDPGGGLRGCRAAALGLPGAPKLVRGWIVVRGRGPVLLYRRGRRRLDLGEYAASAVGERGFFRSVELRTPGNTPARLYVATDGPGLESLRAEFLPASRWEEGL